jgi:putative phosphoribosyl transferase
VIFVERSIEIPITRDLSVAGDLEAPQHSEGLVIIPHGAGHGRRDKRSRAIARALHEQRLTTVMLDLLVAGEAAQFLEHDLRFEAEFLAARLDLSVDWLQTELGRAGRPAGCFGIGVNGAAALMVAADHPKGISAVGAAGLAVEVGDQLARVQAPAMLVVAEGDKPALDISRRAQRDLPTDSRLEVIEGTADLFADRGAAEAIARMTAEWFASRFAAIPHLAY